MKRVFKRISEGLGETPRGCELCGQGVGEKLGGGGRNSEGLGRWEN